MESISDLHTQTAYLRSLCDYVNSYLGDLQAVRMPDQGMTPHQHGIIYAATNKAGGDVKRCLEEAQRHAETWSREVRDAVNGYS